MLNPYHQKIAVRDILQLQQFQNQETLFGQITVPANSVIDGAVSITSYGHFMLLYMTGDYTTKVAGPLDDGICRVAMQLIDGINSRNLFSDPVPCDMILSPGRRQILPGVGAASQELRILFPFVYTFQMSGRIIVRVRNDSDFENIVRIAFTGIRIFPDARQTE